MSLENDEALECLLVNIRSVVLSSKGGVLLTHLQDDYRNLLGTGIPFEKFGYSCLEDLLLAAPGFVSIKKDSNGQLYAEAVADSSTAHLSNLISKQKRSKSKKDPKPKFPKKNSYYRPGSRQNVSVSLSSYASTGSRNDDEKNQEIEELKSKLEREKTLNEELSFEVNRLQIQLKIANKALQYERNYIAQQKSEQGGIKEFQDLKMRLEKEKRISEGYSSEFKRISVLLDKSEKSLRLEKSGVQKLKEQLNFLQAYAVEKNTKDEEINNLKKEIEDLKSKLEKEKKISRENSSQMIRLNSLVKIGEDSLSKERETVKKLECKIESLQSATVKEASPVYEYLNPATNSKDRCKSLQNISKFDSWNGHLHLLETDAAKQLGVCSNLSPTSDQSPTLADLKSFCEQQMSEQMQKFVNQIKKQNQKLMLLEKTQQSHYQKLNEKIRICSESVNMENIIQRLLKHPQFMKSEVFEHKSFYASDNLCQSMPSITPISSQSDNDSERSFKATSSSTIARGKYGPPQVEAYRSVSTSVSYSKGKMNW